MITNSLQSANGVQPTTMARLSDFMPRTYAAVAGLRAEVLSRRVISSAGAGLQT
jgi:hypothetical protein